MLLILGGGTADADEKEPGDKECEEGKVDDEIKESVKGGKMKMGEMEKVKLTPHKDELEDENSNDSESKVNTDEHHTKPLSSLKENGEILPNSELKTDSSIASEKEVAIVDMDDFQTISLEDSADDHEDDGCVSIFKIGETQLQTCVPKSGVNCQSIHNQNVENGMDLNSPKQINLITPELNRTTCQEGFEKDRTKTERMKRKSVQIKQEAIVIHHPSSKEEEHVMDEGWAWLVLVAGALNHILGDGVIQSLGVFLIAWQVEFPGSVSQLSWILSLLLGIAYVAGPVGSALCKRFSIRQVVMAGTILTTASFAGASQASTLWHLYVTFALAGLGFALTIQPSSVIITYYFDRLLARANGISYAGAGVGIFILSPLFQHLIDKFGWQGALLIIAGLVGNNGICAALYRPTPLEIKNRNTGKKTLNFGLGSDVPIKPRMRRRSSVAEFSSGVVKTFDFKLLKDIFFCLLILANFLLGFAYAIVILYTPARAVHAGHHTVHSAFLMSVLGISSFLSRILHGYIIDYQLMSATILTAISYFVCAISCMVNPITDNYVGLVILSIFIGLSSGVFNSTVPIIAKEFVGIHRVSGGVGLIHLMLGTGVTLGCSVAGILVDATGSYDIPFYVSGICFTICSCLVSMRPLANYLREKQQQRQHHASDICIISSRPSTCSTAELVGQVNIAMEID